MVSFGASLLSLQQQILSKHVIWFFCPNQSLLITILCSYDRVWVEKDALSPDYHLRDRLWAPQSVCKVIYIYNALVVP